MGKRMNTDQFAGFMSAVAERLPRDLDTELVQKYVEDRSLLERVLRTALFGTVIQAAFAPWKTIRVGTFSYTKDIKSAFKAAKMTLGDWAVDILGKSELAKAGEADVEFVRVKVSDLGFSGPTKLRDILAAGQKQGLKLCLPEDGPAIRLSYTDQPNGEIVWLAMEPIEDSDGNWSVLCVNCNGSDLWLNASCNDLVSVWYPENEFFFRK